MGLGGWRAGKTIEGFGSKVQSLRGVVACLCVRLQITSLRGRVKSSGCLGRLVVARHSADYITL